MIINMTGGGGGAKAYTIVATAGSNGTITPSGETAVIKGGSQTYTMTPDTGYVVDDVIIDEVSVGAETTHTFNPVNANHTISVTFKIPTYTVTCSVVSGTGTISADPSTGITSGGSSKVTCVPGTKFHVSKLLVNSVDVTSALVNNEYTITEITADQDVKVTFEEAETGSFYIDKALLATTPTACVKYNDGMTQELAKTMVWSWLNPSVVKDGEVVYFLDKSDLSKKLDGTAADLTGGDGDVMVSIPPIWWKVITNDTSKLEIKVSTAEFDGAVTAHKWNGTVASWLHLGMFDMTNSAANSVYSTTLTPWVSMTNDVARTTAEAKGDKYGTMTYLSWELYQLLVVFASGSCDSQTTVGQDYTGGSWGGSAVAVATADMLTANGYTSSTKSSATTQLMYLFMACPWGNVYQWVSGLKVDGTTTAVINDQAQARGVAVDDSIPSTWTSFTTPSTSGYGTEVQGVSGYAFYPKAASSGSSSTYYCDNFYTSNSGKLCGLVGGYYNNAAYAGVFYCVVGYSSSTSVANFGARLQCVEM